MRPGQAFVRSVCLTQSRADAPGREEGRGAGVWGRRLTLVESCLFLLIPWVGAPGWPPQGWPLTVPLPRGQPGKRGRFLTVLRGEGSTHFKCCNSWSAHCCGPGVTRHSARTGLETGTTPSPTSSFCRAWGPGRVRSIRVTQRVTGGVARCICARTHDHFSVWSFLKQYTVSQLTPGLGSLSPVAHETPCFLSLCSTEHC